MAAFKISAFVNVLISSIVASTLNDTESLETLSVVIRSQNPCFDVHSCKSERKICRCDFECSVYRDCCFDSKEISQIRSVSDYTCYSLSPLNGVFLKSRCQTGWTDLVIRRKCEEEVPADKNWFVPVTNPDTKVAYRNKYCARCNDVNDTVKWQPIIECPTLDDSNDTSGLIYDGASERWGIWIVKNGRSNFRPCHLRASPPHNVSKSNLRECVPNVKHRCPSDWEDEIVKEKCMVYYSPVNVSGSLYGNIHCALCNGEKKTDRRCLGNRFGRNTSEDGFRYTFDQKDAKKSPDCKENEPSPQKLKDLDDFCKTMKLIHRDGRCIPS